MVRLHLVGFTTDLKNLIFADERGATSGKYVVSVDARLKHTLDEVARLEEDDYDSQPEEVEAAPEPEAAPAAPRVVSKLTPKEIQALLRQGKTEEQVARLAGTNVDWVRRFSFAILAERRDVIDAVRKATLSKPRLGPSGMNIGDAVEENLGAKRLRMGPEAIEEAWKAMRKNGRWQVSFEYESRGQKRLARYSFDPNTRQVEPLNDIALELGWRPDSGSKAAQAKPAAGPPKIVSGVRPGTGRAAAAKTGAAKSSTRSPGTRAGSDRPLSAGTRPVAKAPARPAAAPTRKSGVGARANQEAAQQEEQEQAVQEQPESPRRGAPAPEEPQGAAPPPPPPVGEDLTGDEFIIQRPRNPEKREYGSLPTVWRPSRRN
ncbi:MAG TPA: septation protein SepH [Actinomycetota bacterium]|nr:septation protein SepH [Actinomycetota bacterium]